MCIKNYAVRLDNFWWVSTNIWLHSQYIKKLNKIFFKFLNAKNLLLFKHSQKKRFYYCMSVLYLSPSVTGFESTTSSFRIKYFYKGVNK